ncbi:PhzF family phenazine biosynthesis protein [Pararhodobacter sp.]
MLRHEIRDAFTETSVSGNPLAIVHDAGGLSTARMQTLAREFNLSETIFVMPPADAAHAARVRIFFPSAEIPFAGHPTIGCAICLSGLAGDGPDARAGPAACRPGACRCTDLCRGIGLGRVVRTPVVGAAGGSRG